MPTPLPSDWPITFDDVLAARDRLAPHLAPTALRDYPLLDALVGHDIHVLVKHENHHPTQSFKIRNGLNAILGRTAEQRARGVIGASTGNNDGTIISLIAACVRMSTARP